MRRGQRRPGRQSRDDSQADDGEGRGGLLRSTESWRGVAHVVQPSSGRSERIYRCPGCDHEVSGRTAHLVVWPAEIGDGVDARRHWHARCWRSRPGAH